MARAACNGTAAAARCNGTAVGAACNDTVGAVTCNGMTKAVADVASSKPEMKDEAASLKTYVVGSKATPNLWHARIGHVHFDGVKRTATSNGVLGIDLEKGGEDMPCTSCHEAKLTLQTFPLHDEREEQVLRLNLPSPRTVIVVPVPSVQRGEQHIDRLVGPAGSKAPTSGPPPGPSSSADSAPVGPEDGPFEDGGDTADHEEEGEMAVDEQPSVAHEHEPSPAASPIQPIPHPPRRFSRPNKGVTLVRFQPSAMSAHVADDENNPYDMAYLAEDDCDTDRDDEVEYLDEDEEEEGAWGDADDASDNENQFSTGGYLFKLGKASVSWQAKKLQGATKLSSTESELVAAVEAGKEGRKLRFLLWEF
ncbi:unnamed protein product [Closterium sp. NIES-65]|nr:unnamed protein product [Closterium sp. NIES-65]